MTLAHMGPITPARLWSSWDFDPFATAGLVVAAMLYRIGAERLPGRSQAGPRAAAGHGALVLVAITIMSPLDALSETLFSAHMVQHLLLILVVPPLLLVGRTGRTMLMGLPIEARRRVNSVLRRRRRALDFFLHPTVVVAIHAVVLWLWHAPGPYEAALGSEWLHALEHITFVLTSLGVWRIALARRTNLGVRIGVVFATALQSGLLAAALLFAEQPLYPSLGRAAYAWGLTPLSDQQLAAVVMWVPMGLTYLVVVLGIAFRGFRRLELVGHA